jgi:hypothetical protein
MGPSGAVKLLRARFPDLANLLADPDDPDFDAVDAHHSYGEFGREVLRRQNDSAFLASVCPFLDDLALSGQSILEELFVIDVLEVLAKDAEFARRLCPLPPSEAHNALRTVAREIYGRSI